MKLMLYVVPALIAFLAAVLVPAALKGYLSKEGMEKLRGGGTVAPIVLAPDPSSVDFLVDAIKQREGDLDRREDALDEREKRIEQMQTDLDELRTEIVAIQTELHVMLDAEDEAHQERLQAVADDLAKMKAKNAVEVLKDWHQTRQLKVLKLMPARQRTKIFDTMDPSVAAPLLEALQQPRI